MPSQWCSGAHAPLGIVAGDHGPHHWWPLPLRGGRGVVQSFGARGDAGGPFDMCERASSPHGRPIFTDQLLHAVQYVWACSIIDPTSAYEVYDCAVAAVTIIAWRAMCSGGASLHRQPGRPPERK